MSSDASGYEDGSSDMDELQDVGHQASMHETPEKSPRFDREIPPFESQHD